MARTSVPPQLPAPPQFSAPLAVESAERLAARRGFVSIVVSHFLCAFGFSVFSLFPKYLMTARGLSQAETGPATMGFPLGALLFSPVLALVMARFPKPQIVRFCALSFCVLTSLFCFAPEPA